jgi:hypothetical protein
MTVHSGHCGHPFRLKADTAGDAVGDSRRPATDHLWAKNRDRPAAAQGDRRGKTNFYCDCHSRKGVIMGLS